MNTTFATVINKLNSSYATLQNWLKAADLVSVKNGFGGLNY